MFVNNRGYSKPSVGVGPVYWDITVRFWNVVSWCKSKLFPRLHFHTSRKLVTLTMTHKDGGSLGHVKCYRGRPVEGDAYCLHSVPCHASTDAVRFRTVLNHTMIHHKVARKTTGLSCVRVRRICILVCVCELFS